MEKEVEGHSGAESKQQLWLAHVVCKSYGQYCSEKIHLSSAVTFEEVNHVVT